MNEQGHGRRHECGLCFLGVYGGRDSGLHFQALLLRRSLSGGRS